MDDSELHAQALHDDRQRDLAAAEAKGRREALEEARPAVMKALVAAALDLGLPEASRKHLWDRVTSALLEEPGHTEGGGRG
jgi:hypothetical protein